MEQGVKEVTPLYNTNADAEWEVDPAGWRDLPDSEPTDEDEDVPTSRYVKDVLGFDPDEEDWT